MLLALLFSCGLRSHFAWIPSGTTTTRVSLVSPYLWTYSAPGWSVHTPRMKSAPCPLDPETWWRLRGPPNSPIRVEDNRYGQSGGTFHPPPERPNRGVPSRPEPERVRPEDLARDQGPNRSASRWQHHRHFLVFPKWKARPRSTRKRVQLSINAPLPRHNMSLWCGPLQYSLGDPARTSPSLHSRRGFQ